MKYKDIKDYELITAYPIPGILLKFGKEQSKIDEYVILYNKYRKMITQYIISEINLKDWDEQINKQKYIKPLDETQMDIYQYCVSDELKYIYIRNNIHIERLTKEEKEFLNKVNHTKKELTQEEKEYIKNTYPKVIAEYNGEGRFIANLGNAMTGFLVTENAVVLGIRYNLENPNDIEQVFNANGFCKLIIDQIRIKEKTKLELPIIGNIYSEFGVNAIPKNSKNN